MTHFLSGLTFVGLTAVSTFTVSAAVTPVLTITTVGGASDGVGVSSGKWTGQPSNAPSKGKYVGYQVVPATNNTLGVDSEKSYDWVIDGKNFGTAQGSVWLFDAKQNAIPGPVIAIQSWTDTKIKVRVTAPPSFTARADAVLWVSRDKKSPPPASSAIWKDVKLPIMGIIQSRGYGQCTWFVASTRLASGRHIPTPSAFATSGIVPGVGGITNDYIPAQWDALAYGTSHVAIITTTPTVINEKDGAITYSFTLSEMNADWGESAASSTKTFKLSKANAKGQRTIVEGIKSDSKAASGYYR